MRKTVEDRAQFAAVKWLATCSLEASRLARIIAAEFADLESPGEVYCKCNGGKPTDHHTTNCYLGEPDLCANESRIAALEISVYARLGAAESRLADLEAIKEAYGWPHVPAGGADDDHASLSYRISNEERVRRAEIDTLRKMIADLDPERIKREAVVWALREVATLIPRAFVESITWKDRRDDVARRAGEIANERGEK